MVQEQFGQFWLQLKAPLKAMWDKITDSDLGMIDGNLATFTDVVEKREVGHVTCRRSDEARIGPIEPA